MKRVLIFAALGVFALVVAVFGFYMAFLGLFVLYLPELRSPFAAIPLWKSAAILLLIAASALAPAYASFRIICFALSHFKSETA